METNFAEALACKPNLLIILIVVFIIAYTMYHEAQKKCSLEGIKTAGQSTIECWGRLCCPNWQSKIDGAGYKKPGLKQDLNRVRTQAVAGK